MFIKTDKFGRNIYDVTDHLRDMKLIVLGDNIVKAERCETNILILQKRAGGHWYITYWWTKNANSALDEVEGSEILKFSRKELNRSRKSIKI